jgi:hypothetical protein
LKVRRFHASDADYRSRQRALSDASWPCNQQIGGIAGSRLHHELVASTQLGGTPGEETSVR